MRLLTLIVLAVGFYGLVRWIDAPPKHLPFGCDKTFINAKGEDTGECP